jgi:hypothetical protein
VLTVSAQLTHSEIKSRKSSGLLLWFSGTLCWKAAEPMGSSASLTSLGQPGARGER